MNNNTINNTIFKLEWKKILYYIFQENYRIINYIMYQYQIK